MYTTDFTFDEQNLSDYGLMICVFDGDSVVSGGEIEPVAHKTPATDEYTYYASEINNVLTWTFSICKIGCDITDPEDYFFNQYEESEIAQWLLKTDGYRWLHFDEDDYPDVYYKVYVNMTPYQIDGKTIGYDLTITSNCGYGFSHEYTATFSSENQPLTIDINNDLNRYTYPIVELQTNSNECYIYNANDLEQNLDNGKESHFYNLGDNVTTSKTIVMDTANDTVETLSPDQFNWYFLRLLKGENNIYVNGILAGEHRSTAYTEKRATFSDTYSLPDDVTESMDYVVKGNGIRVSGASGYYKTNVSRDEFEDGDTIPLTSSVSSITFDVYQDIINTKSNDYIYIIDLSTTNELDGQYVFITSEIALKLIPNAYTRTYYLHDGNSKYLTGFLVNYENGNQQPTITSFDADDEISIGTDDSYTYKISFPRNVDEWKYLDTTIATLFNTLYIAKGEIDAFNLTKLQSDGYGKLFELTGLPAHFKTEAAYQEWIDEGHWCMLAIDPTHDYKYKLVYGNTSSNTNIFTYQFTDEAGSTTLKITDGSGGGYYRYDSASSTWSMNGDSYEFIYSSDDDLCSGFLGGIIYVSSNVTISHYSTPENFPVYDESYNIIDSIYDNLTILGSSDWVYGDTGSGILSGDQLINLKSDKIYYYRAIYKFTTAGSVEFNVHNAGGTFIKLCTASVVTLTVTPMSHHQPSYTITLTPHTTGYYNFSYCSVSWTNNVPLVFYIPTADFDNGCYETLNNYDSAYINIPYGNEIYKGDNLRFKNRPIYVYNYDSLYSQYNITGLNGAVETTIAYDEYNPVVSEQSVTIRYREIRRVLI